MVLRVLHWHGLHLICLRLGDFISSTASFACGGPPGLHLGAYFVLPWDIFLGNLVFLCNADDTQMYLSQCLVVFPWVVTRGPHSLAVFHIWLDFPAFCLSLISSLHSAVSHHFVRSVCIYFLSVSVFVTESLLYITTSEFCFELVRVLFFMFGLINWIVTPA